jgi:ribosomal protein S18 acetylase RimI-like enzyme
MVGEHTVSASESLNGYQFRYTPKDEYRGHHSMTALQGDQKVGLLLWSDRDQAPLPAGSSRPGFTPLAGEIQWAGVNAGHRGHGIAKEMIRQAHAVDPRVHHGRAVSREGAALVRSLPEYGHGRV